MRPWSQARAVIHNLFRKKANERELDDEVRVYLDHVIEERIAAGMPAAEARRTALVQLGGMEPVKQAVREGRAGAGVERLWQDVHYGARQLWKNPGFTATVILTLSLSIGANTAIFSIVNGLMLKSLPYARPERMGTIYTRVTGTRSMDDRHKVNGEQWELLRDRVPSLMAAIAAGRTGGINLQAGSHVEYLHAGRVSAHYLDVLNIEPVRGRNFSEEEDRPNGPKAVILSYHLWRDTFGLDPEILGRSVLLKSEPYTVIGVLPEGATKHKIAKTARPNSLKASPAAESSAASSPFRNPSTTPYWQEPSSTNCLVEAMEASECPQATSLASSGSLLMASGAM